MNSVFCSFKHKLQTNFCKIHASVKNLSLGFQIETFLLYYSFNTMHLHIEKFFEKLFYTANSKARWTLKLEIGSSTPKV